MDIETKKSLKIKTGILKRSIKELHSYELEAVKDRERMEKLVDENCSESSVKKQEEVLKETILMIPNSRNRLTQALIILEEYLNGLESNEEIKETAEWIEAKTIGRQGREIIA